MGLLTVDCCQLSLINNTDYFLTQTTQIYAETLRSDYPFIIREYAEAHTLTLVLYRPDGERKRSVRVLRKSRIIYKLARMVSAFSAESA